MAIIREGEGPENRAFETKSVLL